MIGEALALGLSIQDFVTDGRSSPENDAAVGLVLAVTAWLIGKVEDRAERRTVDESDAERPQARGPHAHPSDVEGAADRTTGAKVTDG